MRTVWPDTQLISLEHWAEQIEQPGWWIMAEAAINPHVLEYTSEPLSESRLYWDEMGERHASISPYLLPVSSLSWLQAHITARPHWGMAIQLDPSLHALSLEHQQRILLRHFRTWTLVQMPDNEQGLLRLTDWDIFHVLWQATQTNQQPDLKGPIHAISYWESGDEAVHLTLLPGDIQPDRVVPTPIPLDAKQYQALSVWAQRHQYQDYRQHLQAHHPKTHDWQAEQWDTFLFTQTSRAHELGFLSPNEVVRYLSLCLIFGEHFTTEPWAHSVLTAPHYQGQQSRMDRLFEQALTRLDEESSPL